MTDGNRPPREATTGAGSSTLSPSPFQAAHLLERCLSDRDFCTTLVQKFATRAAELSLALDQAALHHDAAELSRQAHAIKGMAANLSADALQTWAAALERALRAGNEGSIRPLVARVRAEMQRCIEAVPSVIEQLGARD